MKRVKPETYFTMIFNHTNSLTEVDIFFISFRQFECNKEDTQISRNKSYLVRITTIVNSL